MAAVERSGMTPSHSTGSVDSAMGSSPGSAASPGEIYDPNLVRSYLYSLLPVLMGASPSSLDRSMFSRGGGWKELVSKFAGGEGGAMTLFVDKVRREGVEEEAVDEEDLYDYSLSLSPSYTPLHVSSLAFIKRVPTLEPSLPLPPQLHLLSLFGPAGSSAPAPPGPGASAEVSSSNKETPGERDGPVTTVAVRENPYEALHSLVHNVVSPWFDAYVDSRGGGLREKGESKGAKAKDQDAKMGIPMTKRKFAELELSLLHLQQNVEIPDIHLTIHPVIRATVERCREAGTRATPDELEPPSLLGDSSFLNKLQSDVNSWIKEIQNVTKLSRDVASGTASQEVNFWLSMERALEGIEEQLRSEPIVLTLDILKHAKRFHATVSFIADTGLKESTDKVHKYNQLMKDFPLNDLLSATDLEKIQEAVWAIFEHINKKLKLSPYPIRRALPLVEAISRDLNDQLLKVLGSQRIMYLEYAQFERVMVQAAEVFATWDDMIKGFTNVAREVTRKRQEKFLPVRISPAHAHLMERIVYLRQWRKQHQQLVVMTSSLNKGLLGSSANAAAAAATGENEDENQLATQKATFILDIDMAEEISAAYENVKSIDALDVSPDGTQLFLQAETAYNERVSRVEGSLIAVLREKLGAARNAKQMFTVLSRFNALFVRPKIRGAIQEYQSQLIESVKDDIKALHDKFKEQYKGSETNHMANVRDLPDVAGTIVWAKQIERQLASYMKRVEDVLGKGWELYAEGQKLQSESNSFRKKLDTRPIFEAWVHDIQRRDLSVSGRIFQITRNRAAGNVYQLDVKFDPHIIGLFKEVRNLLWLNLQVPHTISNVAKDARRAYPHAVSLMETVRTYTQTVSKVNKNPGIQMLVAEIVHDVQQMISRGMSYKWEQFVNSYDSHRQLAYLPPSALDGRESRQATFVREFASVVSLFQDKVHDLIEMDKDISRIIEELHTCSYTREAFFDLLAGVQKTIDRLNLEGYPNLDEWVAQIDARIEAVLIERLRHISQVWCTEFSRDEEADGAKASALAREKRRVQEKKGKHVKRDRLELKPLVHEIRIQNQVIYLDPPIEYARARWFRQLHDVLAVVCGLKRIQSSRYEIGMQIPGAIKKQETTYTSLLTRFNDQTLERPFALIEGKIAQVGQYVAKWLQFQSLWDLESEHVYARLGDSLSNWQQLLSEIRKTRSTFDNSDTQRSFGIFVVDYEQVQSKVNAKYDSWQRDILNRFGSKLGNAMKDVHAAIKKARSDLEHYTIEGSSTAQAVSFITFVQDLKRKTKKWAPEMEIFGSGQKTLERQRYMFPQDWLYVDQVEGEWSAFNEILSRKNASIQEQLAGLQMKIIAEDKIVGDKIAAIVAEWEQNKPIQGTLKADTAMNTINVFEGRVNRLAEERDLVLRAKEALDLEHAYDDRLDPVFEELRDLKAVWTALSGTWSQIGELRETNWNNVQPRKLRQSLDALLNQTKDMPSRMRQYAAFEFVQDSLRQLLKNNLLVGELKSEAMRERHWRSLFKQLKVQGHYTPSQMTLGTVWDLDLKKHETTIKAVIVQAQGELALEEYLKQVRENWTNYTLDLVNYQNKCRLIRGWDNLFQLAGDNLNALRAMSMSPHYKVFEEEASLWEDRLSKISVLFDTWIDVQRQWVYLEGIFSGSAEIRHILPVESSRFQNINSEFLTVMKKVYKSPFVLDVLNIPGVQKSLERLADLLSKIQKALGEYLERERALFPRFYFVGDEDLLEIIGNSKDIVRIMKHLKKMFAGLSTVLLDEDTTKIEGMGSREGEEVRFKTPILLKDYAKINDWLGKIESEMRVSLAQLLSEGVAELQEFYCSPDRLPADKFLDWIDKYPAQLVVLSIQVIWTTLVDSILEAGQSLQGTLDIVLRGLDLLADTVLTDISPLKRRKCEHLITELVHQRDAIRGLMSKGVSSNKDFEWLYHMRFYLNQSVQDPLDRLTVHVASATFPYGFEYLGVPDRLVQTPLTDRCYLTLTQALDAKLGGAPFGPAGTGKTESVKALGVQLGRFVLVFCCDETFDFQAMGRIFIGLCRVGAWGCFDEFNRLEERILSAVSQQVQSIQHGLAATVHNPNAEIELVGKNLKINSRTGIFITTNPTYAGRSNLPDNLKKLFRNMAMTHPDRELIAQVMLFSQGFRSAEILATKIVPFFNLCSEQLSPQPHYDFGLRALKAVLVSAGQLKRERLQFVRAAAAEDGVVVDTASSVSDAVSEQEILIQSVTETIVPKLVADDVPLLTSLLSDVFPGVEYKPVDLDKLKEQIAGVCAERHLADQGMWTEKVLQLYQIQKISHGLMMVGPSGTGKTQAWQVLLAALERLEGVEGVSYVIDPKAVPKEALYGTLDPTTREWNDGLFTHILRKIVDNVRGESSKRHWIIFDGDVDPEWVENLNSVLDDNKLLTLPNGERLNLPPNVRIMFEVEHLKFATLATVSRCGMIWFSEDVISPSMIYSNYLGKLRAVPLGGEDDDVPSAAARRDTMTGASDVSPHLETQRKIADAFEEFFTEDGLVTKALDFASSVEHIMDFTVARALNTLFSLLNKTVRNIIDHNNQHSDFPLSTEQMVQYATKRLVVSIVWAFTGDSKLDTRADMGEYLRGQTGVELPPLAPGASLIDFDVQINNAEWISWTNRVPTIEIETHAVSSADVVVPTMDTVRHEEVLYSWLSEHKPLMLCGPPGSGKTMTLFSALRKLPDMEVVGLNFSSATTPELILKTFEQYCEYRKTPNGVVLAPIQIGRWLVVFCDEINLPAQDKYGTQRVISFLRQLVESGGYWRTSDKSWVSLERIQFVGACNPPTDPGRVPLSHRFLRHAPLVMVDYPGEVSLMQIYGTFNRALLKVIPNLRGHADPLTSAMIDFYLASQKRFTPDIQAHYVYSPRELTRWMRGIYEAIKPLETLSVEGLVRVWAHEALRLFQDRLVTEEERAWTDENIDETAMRHFPTINKEEALARPILFSNWLSKHYIPVEREQLREYAKARLKVFYEEELDVPLVLFNDVLDHVLRIDRVFRQVQGHLLLIGVSGSGKTTLSRFVAWMNGLSIFQVKVHNKYKGEDFDEDLRTVLRRAGTKAEKICFIMDESNVLDSGFLERMNTLLANAEVPGLFEGDEYSALMTACKEGAARDGLMLDSHEELYRWFTQQVAKNLHVVFTMNPPENGLASRASTSPALFNRCVLDWFGDWSDQAFYQVAMEFTSTLDLDVQSYNPPANFPIAYRQLSVPPTHRSAVVNALVHVHQSLYDINRRLARRQGRYNNVTPRHYLDFIDQYVKLSNEKRDELEEQQRHLNVGLDKLRDTVLQVEELRKSLAVKRTQLEAKNAEANEKLKRMVADQQEAEQKKAASIEIQAALEIQERDIAERKQVVMGDLADAEPAVREAQSSVSNIKKQHLTEVRSMGNPPEAVKYAMESVCTILGHKIDSWKTVQGIIRRDDFIASIVNFDTDRQMTRSLRERMKREYLSKPSYNFETVNRASKACGPLAKWVIAQVRFSEILDRVGPLRDEVQSLEHQAESTKEQASTIVTMIAELEASIATYKDEYAALISETQAIKAEMERVQTRVDRSIKLLDSLSSEKERWEAGSRTFETQMSTISGDALLSAAFLAYAGFFDQHYRELMWHGWSNHLSDAGIKYKQELSLADYLSTADDRLDWQSKSLPADTLCTENAIMLKRFTRYPLIIDPSGQATTFLLNEFKASKMTVTSFLDESFLKQLESALRFGNPLLIQDVEHLDPILNAVLNKELRRTGGRVLIRLGNQDIDFSPSFTMFLSTRDPSVEFSPDICSRVTFVNFTMTRSSLQSQSLDQVLRVERPDTEKKRTDLMKLQGEFRLRLRHLEKSLLQALNESKGNILDDDKVIDTLETLKKEAAEITSKVEETDLIMQEVEQVTAEYLPLAKFCSSIYFVLEELSLVDHFYQFSLRFFLDVFDYVLHHNPNLKGVSDSQQRLDILIRDLFFLIFKRTSRSLAHRDYLLLAVLLAQIKIREGEAPLNWDEFDFFLEGGEAVLGADAADDTHPLLSPDQLHRLRAFTKLPSFQTFGEHVEANTDLWRTFLESSTPEKMVPQFWEEEPGLSNALRRMLVIKCLRPDRLAPVTEAFVNEVFQTDLLAESVYDLQTMVSEEVAASTPVALCSVPGFDASFRVENLVNSTGAKCTSVAMGSQEGFGLADQAITTAARSGFWVLLKNVHLSASWLGSLEKKLQSLNPNRNFRLFLTMETNTSVPVSILRASRIIYNEGATGVKANLMDSLKGVEAAGAVEKARLLFLSCWFHSVVLERLRYPTLGFSRQIEYNNSDLTAALSTISSWVDRIAGPRKNVNPDDLPWQAVRALLVEVIYGGKVTTPEDQRVIKALVQSLFTPKAFEINFPLVEAGEEVVHAPDGTNMAQFAAWARNLPEHASSLWVGLPATAERLVADASAQQLLSKLRKMKNLSDDEDEPLSQATTAEVKPAWQRQVQRLSQEWLELLQKNVRPLSDASSSSLDRFFLREVQIAGKLLSSVRSDLQLVLAVIRDGEKHTNRSRSLVENLNQGTIPSHWRVYDVPSSTSVTAWLGNFHLRLQQLDRVTQGGPYERETMPLSLGLLLVPGAYLTATRQVVAKREGVSLEELNLVFNPPDTMSTIFKVEGLICDGATLSGQKLTLTDGRSQPIPSSSFGWTKSSEVISLRNGNGGGEDKDWTVVVPLYTNQDRTVTLASLELRCDTPPAIVAQRTVAIRIA